MPGTSEEPSAKPLKVPTIAKSHSRKSASSSSRISAQVALQRLEKEQELQKQKLLAEKQKMEAEITAKMAEMQLQHQTLQNALEDELENLSFYSSIAKTDRTAEWVKRQEQKQRETTANPTVRNEAEPSSQQKLQASSSTPLEMPARTTAHNIAQPRELPTQYRQLVSSSIPLETPVRTAAQSIARDMFPKKLPIFSGCSKEWAVFLNCYEETTKACGYTDGENTIRLVECLRGPARDAVQSKLRLPNAAPLIIKRLEKLFGKPAQLIRLLTDNARKLDPPKPEQLNSLITFGLEVINQCDHLTLSNMQSHFNNPELLADLVEKLPATRRLEWSRYKNQFAEPTLKHFGDFMEALVDDACDVTAYVPPRTDNSRSSRSFHSHVHARPAETEPTTSVPNAPLPSHVKCLFCAIRGHVVKHCEVFKRLNVDERCENVAKLQLCSTCLNKHGSKPCRSRFLCRVPGCSERHHTLLHRGQNTYREVHYQAHHLSKQSAIFRIVPVTVYNNGRAVDAVAFLDEGSSVTLVEADLALQLGLNGEADPLELCWTSDVSRKEEASRRVSFEISAKGGGRRYKIAAAHTINKLSLPSNNFNYDTLISTFTHLQHLPTTSLETARPTLLIGLSDVNLIRPLETRFGQPDEPIAVKSVLGWAIYGPNNESATKMMLGIHQIQRQLEECSCVDSREGGTTSGPFPEAPHENSRGTHREEGVNEATQEGHTSAQQSVARLEQKKNCVQYPI
ncbi:uncharacterized protein LOC133393266 [Anopheles gambiae]|uniref:uncharacterized protein LOC133393266 n=1 Tax=Anopheles gambiae TaxID=7165 RepID=UPI002AC91A6A|nr:uncharacterized protein LOC133393266 [Anopheles gambiae]